MKRLSPVRPDARHALSTSGRCLAPLLLLACLSPGCSVDVAKLRTPGVSLTDAATDAPATTDADFPPEDGGGDTATPPDLAATGDLGPVSEVRPPSDGRGTGDTSGDGAPSVADGAPSVADGLPGTDAWTTPDTGLVPADTGEDSGAPAGDTGSPPDTSPPVDGPPERDGAPPAPDTAPDTALPAPDTALDTALPALDQDLVLWYPFDEASGTIAANAAPVGGTSRNATLNSASYATYGGTATFTTACKVGTHAVKLTPNSYGTANGYVTVPAPYTLAPNAMTIAFWIKLGAAETWARIFDFSNGSTATKYFYLTARTADAPYPMRFGLSSNGHSDPAEERLDSPTALTVGTWYHVAIVLPMTEAGSATYTGTLYLDGLPVDTNPAMTLHPSDIGATSQNWLGRSPFSSDPTLNGTLDDFRIYQRALSAAEIMALYGLR